MPAGRFTLRLTVAVDSFDLGRAGDTESHYNKKKKAGREARLKEQLRMETVNQQLLLR